MNNIIKKIYLIKSLDELSPHDMAQLVKYLIDHEVKPGGPYNFISDNEWLNNHIYHLFADKGKKLNETMKFSDAHANKAITPDITTRKKNVFYSLITNNLSKSLDTKTLREIERIINKVEKVDYTGEISKLTSIFYNSLISELSSKIILKPIIRSRYSLANVYTWITYSLIDSVLDSKFNLVLIPVITTLQREITDTYLKASVDTNRLKNIFQTVDEANILEQGYRNHIKIDLAKNTFSVFSNEFTEIKSLMSDKSIAHTFGPLEIIRNINDKYLEDVERAMSLYCSARQFNDDLHDWLEDFSDGQITYIISRLLEKANIGIGVHSYSESVEKMKEVYWDSILVESCESIEKDIAKAISLLENDILQKNSAFCKLFLNPIADAAKQALLKHRYDKSFLENMTG